MEQLPITRGLNALLGKPVLILLQALHLHPENPAAPIPNHIAMELLVATVLVLFGVWLGRQLSVDQPTRWQHLIELTWGGVHELADEVIGHGASQFMFFLFSLTLFILGCNLLGLFPTLESPTSNVTVPLGCALLAFAYYHWAGIRQAGVGGYLKHFIGPVWWLAFLMFPIEIVSHLARVLSLTVRLFANIFAGDLVTMVMVALFPLAGVVFLGLHLFVALLQTYVFVLLTMVYLGGAVEEAH